MSGISNLVRPCEIHHWLTSQLACTLEKFYSSKVGKHELKRNSFFFCQSSKIIPRFHIFDFIFFQKTHLFMPKKQYFSRLEAHRIYRLNSQLKLSENNTKIYFCDYHDFRPWNTTCFWNTSCFYAPCFYTSCFYTPCFYRHHVSTHTPCCFFSIESIFVLSLLLHFSPLPPSSFFYLFKQQRPTSRKNIEETK